MEVYERHVEEKFNGKCGAVKKHNMQIRVQQKFGWSVQALLILLSFALLSDEHFSFSSTSSF